MIIQTRRRNGRFSSVLRGVVVRVDALADGHIPLRCRGLKAETGEAYEFRVLLTEAEFEVLARSRRDSLDPDPRPGETVEGWYQRVAGHARRE